MKLAGRRDTLTMDEYRQRASERALAKARLKQARENRVKELERRQAAKVWYGQRSREMIANGGIWMRRCLNPDCLCWFATTLPKANWCQETCQRTAYASLSCVTAQTPVPLFARHALVISKRNARIYDTPKLTPYAHALISKVEDGGTSIEDVLHAASVQAEQRAAGFAQELAYGTSSQRRNHCDKEPSSTYSEAWFMIGFLISTALPGRPCDHSGFH